VSVEVEWRRSAWRARAIGWAERSLAERDVEIEGRPEQFHIRPWSTVIRLATNRGAVFFKAIWPPEKREAAITEALARWRPKDVAAVLAADRTRGWLLLDDAGEKLRTIIKKDTDIRRWRTVLPQYAELQLAVAKHANQLLELGAPDRRAASLAIQYERLLKDRHLLQIGVKRGLTESQYRKLVDFVPQVREWSAYVSGTVPETIQHDDLHDGQVFVKDGRYRILDWGDTVVSHPFYSLTVALRSIAQTFKLKDDALELRRLTDLYLEPFTAVATKKQLLQNYAIAKRLGRICRALTWASVVVNLPPAQRKEERDAVPGWLALFLEAATS
jgi:hypothetical protein